MNSTQPSIHPPTLTHSHVSSVAMNDQPTDCAWGCNAKRAGGRAGAAAYGWQRRQRRLIVFFQIRNVSTTPTANLMKCCVSTNQHSSLIPVLTVEKPFSLWLFTVIVFLSDCGRLGPNVVVFTQQRRFVRHRVVNWLPPKVLCSLAFFVHRHCSMDDDTPSSDDGSDGSGYRIVC